MKQIPKYQTAGNLPKKYKFSPELAAQLEAQLRQAQVSRSDATARVSSGQTTQQVRKKKETGDTIPKTRAEGSYRNIERRRKSGKTADQESSERDIANATKSTGYAKAADFFHQLGEAAMADAAIMSFVMNPVRTATSLVGGIVGNNAVDKTVQNFTRTDEKPEGQTWSEWVNQQLGLRQGHMVGQFSNPGMWLGGAVGYKAPGAIDYLVRADMPRFGITPTTQFFFKPNYLGANGSAIGQSKVIWPARDKTRFKPILEEDIPKLREMFNSGKFQEITNPRTGEKVKMFLLEDKQPIRADELEKLLQNNDPSIKQFQYEFDNPTLTESGKTELNKAKKKYKNIYDKYSEGTEELKEQTKQDYGSGINWDWYGGGILSTTNIPVKVATSPVFDPRYGKVVDSTPIMERFFKNILDKDGIIQKTQKYLIDKGIMIPYEGKWLYQPQGETYKEIVDPSRFVLNWILENELNSTNRIPFFRRPEQVGTGISYHSTPTGDKTLFSLFANPNKRPLFTSTDDGAPGFYSLKQAYQKTKFGTSIPVMTKVEPIEIKSLKSENGLHSSNNFGNVGELMRYFETNGGRAQKVLDVSDARNIKGNTGQRQNEYNFGTGTPDIGFLLNTFDLEYPANIVGPFQGYKKGGKLTKFNN